MNYSRTLIFVALAGLCGCATPVKIVDYYDLPSSALSNLRSMTVLPEQDLSEGDYTDLGVVSGFSCNLSRRSAVNFEYAEFEKKAVEQLRLNAAVMGAAHITTPQCIEREKLDMTNNCWTSLTCNSHALIEVAAAP
jgi:hypothetical protein